MIHVYTQWDAEGSVWVAESDDVPALVTEAETLEALSEKLRVLIPELAQESGLPSPSNGGYPFHLSAEREAGCHFVRQGKGDHELWHSPITNRPSP